MQCVACGAELPEEARFCWRCGAPQKAEMESAIEWEMCETREENVKVGLGLSLLPHYRFVADAIGPKGRYVAGESPIYKGFPPQSIVQRSNDRHFKKANACLNCLIENLTEAGWEPLETRGDSWYKLRFRRRVR